MTAKQTCDSNLSAEKAATASCEGTKKSLEDSLSNEIQLYLACSNDKATCSSDLTAATAAKSSCVSAKTTVESELATCQYDLIDAQATKSGTGITHNCTALDTPANGATVFSEKGLNSSQTFTCNAGYHLEGSASLGCVLKQQTDTGVQFGWNQGQPTCLRVCPEPMKPTNGFVTKTKGNLEGSVLSYTCDTGYLIEGTDNGSTCQADGTWSLGAPTCGKAEHLANVIVYQFVMGSYDLSSGDYSCSLMGDDGSAVDCEITRTAGAGVLSVRNQQLKGRIAIHGLPENIQELYLPNNSITSIVSIDRGGAKIGSLGSKKDTLTIDLGLSTVSWLPLYANLNFDGVCPME